ncbi:MAG: diacylglycerol/lipid kinase family protein [bacterium]
MSEDLASYRKNDQIRFIILVNPLSGNLSHQRKRRIIEKCAEVLGPGTRVEGWSTKSPGEFCDLAKELAKESDVLVVAGGDGTLSNVINVVAPEVILGFIPFGSGNAWRSTLRLPRSPEKAAYIIKHGSNRSCDLVESNGSRKALLASIGIEGYALRDREKYLRMGMRGFNAYMAAAIKSALTRKKVGRTTLSVDGERFELTSALSVIVTKTPYYGYGFKVVPKARLDDGLLHVLVIYGEPYVVLPNILVTSMVGGNRFGQYFTCKTLKVETDRLVPLQADGDMICVDVNFQFKVIPEAVRIRC